MKKNKKKHRAKGEEEKDEMEEYREKLMQKLSENILIKMNTINEENNKNKIKDDILKANILNEPYMQRLSRIKTFNNVKIEGGFDNKYVVDLEECKFVYEDDIDEEINVINSNLSTIDYFSSKDKILQSLNYSFNNGVKAVLLRTPAYFCKDLENLI